MREPDPLHPTLFSVIDPRPWGAVTVGYRRPRAQKLCFRNLLMSIPRGRPRPPRATHGRSPFWGLPPRRRIRKAPEPPLGHGDSIFLPDTKNNSFLNSPFPLKFPCPKFVTFTISALFPLKTPLSVSARRYANKRGACRDPPPASLPRARAAPQGSASGCCPRKGSG